MRRLIRKIERQLIAAFEFWQNYWYYLCRGHSPRQAWQLASNTL